MSETTNKESRATPRPDPLSVLTPEQRATFDAALHGLELDLCDIISGLAARLAEAEADGAALLDVFQAAVRWREDSKLPGHPIAEDIDPFWNKLDALCPDGMRKSIGVCRHIDALKANGWKRPPGEAS